MLIQRSECIEDYIEITFSDNKTAQFSLFWLRDHSTDTSSINPNTLQRDLNTFTLPSVPEINHQEITNNGEQLTINWIKDNVVSEFGADFLYKMEFNINELPTYHVWGSDMQNKIPDFDFNKIIQSEKEFIPVLDAIEKYGLVTFSNMPSDMEATKSLLEKIGYIRETVFGGLWDFSNNEAHSDSAYTSVGIGLHTDGTYTIDPPGLQLLHCLAFDGEGGFNQFADGFKIAETIKNEDPKAYKILKQIEVPAHYIEPDIQLRGKHAVIREDKNGNFEQICFNNFDRSPFKLSNAEQKVFYRAYGRFQQLINDPNFQVTFQLQPGRAVWFDNWRALHARSSFTGFRHLAGGYTNREEYISKKLTLRGQTPWQE
jgi:trimethyllysine dioxygenase